MSAWVSQVRDAIAAVQRIWSRTRQWRDRLIRMTGIAVLVVAIAYLASFGASRTVPDVEGMSVRSAVVELNEAGIPFEADSVLGIVTRQWPHAGDAWYRWQDVVLTYEYADEELQISWN